MQTNLKSLWWPRGVTFVLSALVALSATFWVFKGMGAGAPAAVAPPLPGTFTPTIDPQIIALALGGGKQAAVNSAPAPTRYVLTGVVATPSQSGAALISIDGKAPKAVRVGAPVDGTLLLQSVGTRSAVLATDLKAAPSTTLELPPLAK
ncbi:MAG: type II secretion system protein N [Rhodoferax sp.]